MRDEPVEDPSSAEPQEGGGESTRPSATRPAPEPGDGDDPGDDTEPDVEPTEAPTPDVLGLVVDRGLHVVMTSAGGSSTGTFESPIGATAVRIDSEERLDFDGAPPGVVRVVLVPDADHVVATCGIVGDGGQALHEGEPGEPVVCELVLGDGG